MKVVMNKCTRCNHEWKQRLKQTPKHCPKCNSPYWNKEKGWYKNETNNTK